MPAPTRWFALLLAALLGPLSARAAPSPPTTLPGAALVLVPCEPDPVAACWEAVLPLRRFAPSEKHLAEPVEADVRLATAGGALLVRVADLPPGQRVEVLLDGLDGSTHPIRIDVAEPGPGVTRLAPRVPLRPGQLRQVKVLLVQLGGDGPVGERAWSPSGPGRPLRWVPALVAERPSGLEAPAVHRDPTGGYTVLAGEGVRVALVEDRPLAPRWNLPPRRQLLPPPWRVEGTTALAGVHPPVSGWYEIVQERLEGDRLVDRRVDRVHLTARPTIPLDWHGLHPPPRWRWERSGRPTRAAGLVRLAVSDPAFEGPARWLVEEMAARHGVTLARTESLRRAQVRLVRPGALPARFDLPRAALHAAAGPDGFAVVLDDGRAWVAAGGTRGAAYGVAALADLLAGGEAPALALADAPAIAFRPIYLELPAHPDRATLLERLVALVRGPVLRGRYTDIVLNLGPNYAYAILPEVAGVAPLGREDLEVLIEAGRSLGLGWIPYTASPAHAGWLTRAHPEWREGQERDLLCTRNPAARAALDAIRAELVGLLAPERFFHVGFDEAWWRRGRRFEQEQCRRCAGTPPWILLADDLGRSIDTLAAAGLDTLVWADLLVEGWNGWDEGSVRVLDRLSPEQRRHLVVLPWSHRGDATRVLLEAGLRVARVHTGYYQWKRAGLRELAGRLEGEGLAVTFPAPWSAFGWAGPPRPLGYHWPAIVLAGTTAWWPEQVDQDLRLELDAVADLPAWLPGRRLPPPRARRAVPLPLPAAAPLPGAPGLLLPEAAVVGGVRFRPTGPAPARPGRPLELRVGRRAGGISLLQAAVWEREVEETFWARQAPGLDGRPVAVVELHLADGSVVTRPLHLGVDTFRPDGGHRTASMWGAAGRLAVPSPDAARSDPLAADRNLYRVDVLLPGGPEVVERVVVRVPDEGAALLVAGVSLLPR